MHRHVITHSHCIARRVEYRARVIATLLDVRREGGAPQRSSHFFRNRVEEMLEYLELDRIKAHDGMISREQVAGFGAGEGKSQKVESRKKILYDFC